MATLSLEFIKADPSGNTTILVTTPQPREQYAPLSRLLMSNRALAAEQVGFVEKTSNGSRLEMMGGEFCGNASRSYAAWLAMGGAQYLCQGGDMLNTLTDASYELQVEVSGHNGPLNVHIEHIGSNCGCFAELDMPRPAFIYHEQDALLGRYSVVGLEGIVHGVLWEQTAEAALLPVFRQQLRQRGLDDSCCGMMFVERQQPLLIRPLVYVGAVGSLVWEQSCGSGSLAVMCALADLEQKSYYRLPIEQPGGLLMLSGDYQDGSIYHTRLAGPVYFTAHGLAHLELT